MTDFLCDENGWPKGFTTPGPKVDGKPTWTFHYGYSPEEILLAVLIVAIHVRKDKKP